MMVWCKCRCKSLPVQVNSLPMMVCVNWLSFFFDCFMSRLYGQPFGLPFFMWLSFVFYVFLAFIFFW